MDRAKSRFAVAGVLAATMIGAICWTGFSEEGVPHKQNGAASIVEDVGIAEDG